MMTRGRTIWGVLVGIALLLSAAVAWADEDRDEDEEQEPAVEFRADTVELLDGQMSIRRPTGWTIANRQKGAVAVFRSTTDERSQIEVRMSDGIAEPRWERFWRSFDTDLRQAGFEVHQGRSNKRFGAQSGLQYEYRLQHGESQQYRLIVWHTRERDRAWVFSIFFPENRRSAYLPAFEEMLSHIQWP